MSFARADCRHLNRSVKSFNREYVILVAFPLNLWLHKRTSTLHYIYIDCFVILMKITIMEAKVYWGGVNEFYAWTVGILVHMLVKSVIRSLHILLLSSRDFCGKPRTEKSTFRYVCKWVCTGACVLWPCAVAYRGGWAWGCWNPPPEIPKSLQNRAKLNPIVKTVKNCWI